MKAKAGTNCAVDYVEIVGGAATCDSNSYNNRFCGEVLSFTFDSVVTAAAAPVIICGRKVLPWFEFLSISAYLIENDYFMK